MKTNLEKLEAANERLKLKEAKHITALKQIAQMTGNGDYLKDMLDMKKIASNALKD